MIATVACQNKVTLVAFRSWTNQELSRGKEM